MPKAITKSHKPATSPKNSKGKAAPAKKIPIRNTLPDETDPEILRANRLLVKAAAAIRAHNEQQRLLEQQEQERQGKS